jgi:NAD(P)H dehydrogenase (quinone)
VPPPTVRARPAEVVVKRVSEIVPDDVARLAHYKLDQKAPVARPGEVSDFDGFVFGVPTRFGNMPAQMKNFIDQSGALWASGALIDKPASVMVSSATQHGGAEATLLSMQIACFSTTAC